MPFDPSLYLEKEAVRYILNLKQETTDFIINRDRSRGNTLYNDLISIEGLQDVEFGSYFGNFLRMSVLVEHDNEATHLKILEVIKRFISDD